MSEFINSFIPPSSTKPPYSKTLTPEDTNYLHRKSSYLTEIIDFTFYFVELASLSTAGLIAKVKDLHDIAYQLGVDEAKEMTRGKYLNLFNRPRRQK